MSGLWQSNSLASLWTLDCSLTSGARHRHNGLRAAAKRAGGDALRRLGADVIDSTSRRLTNQISWRTSSATNPRDMKLYSKSYFLENLDVAHRLHTTLSKDEIYIETEFAIQE